MVKEADSSLASQGTLSEVSYEHLTAPWKVVSIPRSGSGLMVNLRGRRIRRRTVSVANVKLSHLRPADLRHEFEVEFAHAFWRPDFGLAEASTAGCPVYTLRDSKAARGKSDAWAWEYRCRYQDGAESHWSTVDEAKDSFTPLQLDVFHAMRGVYQAADCRPRPDIIPSKGERRAASREETLTRHSVGTQVKREFADDVGQLTAFKGLAYDSSEAFGQIRSPDGDWEKLNSQKM